MSERQSTGETLVKLEHLQTGEFATPQSILRSNEARITAESYSIIVFSKRNASGWPPEPFIKISIINLQLYKVGEYKTNAGN